MDEHDDVAERRSTRDNIHGLIQLSPLLWSVIDTPQFQRLREIKQLGVSYRVFVSASHNRFEHCLGVAYLAGKLVRHLQREQPELDITDRDVSCVELAGLCHDLGHGPWSHVWDGLFIPAVLPDVKWSHEEASEMMFDDLIASNNINIPQEDVDFVKDLIRGEPNHSKDRKAKKMFLFEIVANKKNGIDVDKFDYIRRDTRAIGHGQTFDTDAFISSARVINDEICYSIKEANNLFELCHTRFSLHKRIYNHKTARAIELMIVDALKLAEPHMKIAEQIRDPKKYVHLTDNIMQYIKMMPDERLEASRQLFWRIDTRNLYQRVDFKAYDWRYYDYLKEWFTEESIVKTAKELYDPRRDRDISPKLVESLNKDHVIVDISKMHYGMKDRNPLDTIRFYSKRNRSVSFEATRGDVSTLMPTCFGECVIRVFTREPEYYGLIQSGYNGILDRLDRQLNIERTLGPLNTSVNLDSAMPLTPVDTIPTQPNSRTVSLSNITLDGMPRTPSGSGSFVMSGASPSPPAHAEKTPFARNKGMEVSKNYGLKASPHIRARGRPLLGGESSSASVLSANFVVSTDPEKERVTSGALQPLSGSPSPSGPKERTAGSLLPPFSRAEGSPSPAPSSGSRRRSPRSLQDSTTSAARESYTTLRSGTRKQRIVEDDGSPPRKRSKR